MAHSTRIFRVRQRLSDELTAMLQTATEGDLCFFNFSGGNQAETELLRKQLDQIRSQGVFVIGVFRFPFRFEGKARRMEAVKQYYTMRNICHAVTYLESDGLMQLVGSDCRVEQLQKVILHWEEMPANLLDELLQPTSEINIDLHDVKAFLSSTDGPVYLRCLDTDALDEPLRYLLEAPHLPLDYADGTQMLVQLGYSRDIDMVSFQHINLRLTDLFHKADLFKMGTRYLDEPGVRYRILLLVGGLADPAPRPTEDSRARLARLWMRIRFATHPRRRTAPPSTTAVASLSLYRRHKQNPHGGSDEARL